MARNEVQPERMAELVKHLPRKLRTRVRIEVLQAAMAHGYITITVEGRLQWHLPNKTLLAYFCGRMWCGDSSQYSNIAHAHVWKRTRYAFPDKDLSVLFGVRNLRLLRKKRFLRRLPHGWELVDPLFSTFFENF